MTNINLLTFMSAPADATMKVAEMNPVFIIVAVVVVAVVLYLFKNSSDKETDESGVEKKQEITASEGADPQEVIIDAGDQNLINDAELVAIITAAIMDSMGEQGIEIPEDGLIIRSIRRKTTYSRGYH